MSRWKWLDESFEYFPNRRSLAYFSRFYTFSPSLTHRPETQMLLSRAIQFLKRKIKNR